MNDLVPQFHYPSPHWHQIGSPGQDEGEYVLKALEAQEGETDVANLTGVGALTPQDLEALLNHMTWRDKHMVLWNLLKPTMEPAYSTVIEYSQQIGYGISEGGYVSQMENPDEADPSFKRRTAFLKFLRQQYKYSDVATMVRSIASPEKKAKEGSIARLMRTFIRSMYNGDDAMIPESVTGFKKTIEGNGSTRHIVDLRGNLPTQQNFANLSEAIMNNYGDPDGLFLLCSTSGLNQLGRIITEGSANMQRWNYGVMADGGVSIGNRVSQINTQFGVIYPKADLFLGYEFESNKPPRVNTGTDPAVISEGQTSRFAPKQPTLTSVVVDAPSVTGSKWVASGDAFRLSDSAKYSYRVAAGNKFGLSQATTLTQAGSNVLAGGSITVTITPATSDPNPPTYYVVFSDKAEGYGALDPTNNFRAIGRVAASGMSAVTFVDLNAVLPGTSVMFLLDLSTQGDMRAFGIRRLGSLFSQPLAKNGPFEWGITNLYFTPVYYQTLRMTMLTNVPTGDGEVNPYFGM